MWLRYIIPTPARNASAQASIISFNPTVSHQTIKNGFNPVRTKPTSRGFLDDTPHPRDASNLEERPLRICKAPKMRRASPPATATGSLMIDSSAMVWLPKATEMANKMTRGNSIIVCAIENANPPLAPDLVPWEMVAKKRGPGAKAPETLIITTVTMRVSKSMILLD